VIAKRESTRDFVPSPISKETLSQLLWATCGIRKREHGFLLRVVPSAGALYPIETYVAVLKVEDLKEGLYHLHVPTFSLEFLKEGAFGHPLCMAALYQHMIELASVVFLWSAVIDRCRIRYGERAFRYIYMDVAHMGQNLYLAAAALGLGCCTVGAFYDEEINKILEIDGERESILYMGIIGVPFIEKR